MIECSKGSSQKEAAKAKKKLTSITKRSFGRLPDGREITEYTLSNKNGITVSVINYGGIITSVITPDKEGAPGDIVLGFDTIDGFISEKYIARGPYFGALIGRYANRISKGKFTLDSTEYTLVTNNRDNHMHGGKIGFDKVIWHAEELNSVDQQALALSYLSKDGEEGYPGNLQVTVIYILTADNKLQLSYKAKTDKATPVSLTNHSYFNLAAGKADNALGHQITINADKNLVMNDKFIPTGSVSLVANTALDFKEPHTIGSRIDKVNGGGYAHTYVLNKDSDRMSLAAKVYEPLSGRMMEVFTTEPGLIFYSGNFLDGSFRGKDGIIYSQYYGFALETQHFPDSPNHPEFPSTILRPGETFTSSTIFKFYSKK